MKVFCPKLGRLVEIILPAPPAKPALERAKSILERFPKTIARLAKDS